MPSTSPVTEAARIHVREYEPGDEHAILAGFNRVFRAVGPSFVPRTLERWRWTYERNPSGRRIFLAVTEEGEVVSQFAGIPQRALLDGEPASFCQSVDSFTDPRFRGGLKRPGYFALAGQGFIERYCGPEPDRDALLWGLPMQHGQAWRISSRILRCESLRTQLKLVLRPENARDAEAPGVAVEEVASFPDEIDAFFTAAAAPHGAIWVRDAPHLDWRFAQHPDHRYAIGIARRAGKLVGYAVYRPGVFDDSPDGLVCDWLTLPAERTAGAALRHWLVERARADGAERLTAVFPDTSTEWSAFQRAGFEARPTRYSLAAHSYVRRRSLRWFHDHWFYTLGETDLC